MNGRAHFHQASAERAGRKITATGNLRDFAQCRFVKLAADNLAFRIAKQFGLSGGVHGLNFFSRRCANADGEYDHAVRRQMFCGGDAGFFQILTIRHEHHHFAACIFIHRTIRFVQRAADVCAGNRNGFFVHGQKGFFKRVRIKRQWTLDKSAAGECDQADATVTLLMDKIEHRKFCALQPARQNVAGRHAQRTVQREDHIFAEPRLVGFDIAPLRSRQCQSGQRKGGEQQNVFEISPRRTVRRRELFNEVRRSHFCELRAPFFCRVQKQQR